MDPIQGWCNYVWARYMFWMSMYYTGSVAGGEGDVVDGDPGLWT